MTKTLVFIEKQFDKFIVCKAQEYWQIFDRPKQISYYQNIFGQTLKKETIPYSYNIKYKSGEGLSSGLKTKKEALDFIKQHNLTLLNNSIHTTLYCTWN